MGLPIYLTEFTFFGGTITQKSSKLPFSAEFSDFGKTESSLESVRYVHMSICCFQQIEFVS